MELLIMSLSTKLTPSLRGYRGRPSRRSCRRLRSAANHTVDTIQEMARALAKDQSSIDQVQRRYKSADTAIAQTLEATREKWHSQFERRHRPVPEEVEEQDAEFRVWSSKRDSLRRAAMRLNDDNVAINDIALGYVKPLYQGLADLLEAVGSCELVDEGQVASAAVTVAKLMFLI
jgi:hypothetical protein